MAIFWDVAPCSLVKVYRRFRGACCLHRQGEITLGCETWSLIFREEHILRVLENGVLRIIFVAKLEETAGGWRQ
jgi:hypothetical protein